MFIYIPFSAEELTAFDLFPVIFHEPTVILSPAPTTGFPNLFDPRPPCLDTEDSATPMQGLIFTMIMIIILRFGLLLVVFYDDSPFPY